MGVWSVACWRSRPSPKKTRTRTKRQERGEMPCNIPRQKKCKRVCKGGVFPLDRSLLSNGCLLSLPVQLKAKSRERIAMNHERLVRVVATTLSKRSPDGLWAFAVRRIGGFTPGTLKAIQVALVEPVAYLKDSVKEVEQLPRHDRVPFSSFGSDRDWHRRIWRRRRNCLTGCSACPYHQCRFARIYQPTPETSSHRAENPSRILDRHCPGSRWRTS